MAKGQTTKRGRRIKDISTEPPFGCLRAIRPVEQRGNGHVMWECLCDIALGGCGCITIVRGIHLRSGHTKSCGCRVADACRKANTVHGMLKSAEYRSWYAMKQRCTNSRNRAFANYGGRGIMVCKQWESFENFLADMGKKPSPQHSIDRIHNDGNYEPGNCVWATKKVQARNQRTNRRISHNGQTKPLSEWAEEYGLSAMRLHSRLSRGWSMERSLLPLYQRRKDSRN